MNTNGYTLQQVLGSYGVETSNDTAWAVIDHDAELPLCRNLARSLCWPPA